MPTKTLDTVLKELGWETGFQIPISNVENQALEEEVARLSLLKINTVNKHNGIEGRLEALKHHYKFVNQEIDQTQKLITAHKQQLDCENMRYVNIIQEKKNFETETKTLNKKIEDTEKACAVRKSQLEKHIIKMDKLKAETDWDEAALSAWEESLKKRDEDNELIKKFSEEDERKYNELESRRQILQMDHVTRGQAIAKMVCDIQNYELVMERTGKMIKQQIIERNAMINQWKDTVKILQQRDIEIGRSQEKVICMQEHIEKQQEVLAEQNKFLQQEKDNNHVIVLENQDLTALFAKLRKEYAHASQELSRSGPEVNALKTRIAVTAKHLENERIRSKEFDSGIADKEQKLIKIIDELERLKQKEEDIKNNMDTSAQRVSELEKLIQYEVDQEDVIIVECEKLQNTLFHSQIQLKEVTDGLKMVESDRKTLTNIMGQSKKRNILLRKQLDKNIETAYDFDFRIGLLEKQLYEKDNVHYQDDYEEKEQRIIDLEQELSQHNETSTFLQEQITKIHEEMRRLSTAMSLDKNELETLKEKLEYQMIFFDIGKKQSATVIQSVQEKQVEENLIRLQVANMDKNVEKEDKNIVTQQKLRLTLDQAMKERQLEISATKTILMAKLRALDEEKSRLRSEIAQRHVKLELFQKKYHVALMSLGKDEDGQQLSVSHFKVKVAQEKFFLQQEGDDLDQKIKTAEKEIVAMENTLKLVNVTNYQFKDSLTAVKEDGDEVRNLKEIEEQMIKAGLNLKMSKKNLTKKEKLLNETKAKFEEISNEKNEEKETLIKYETDFRSIRSQEKDKEEKLQRAECHLRKLQRALSNVDLEKYNRDFEIRRMKDANKSVLHQLATLCVTAQVLTPKINCYILHYGLKLPRSDKSPTLSSATSISLTTCSSISLDSLGNEAASPRQSPCMAKVTLAFNL